MVGYRCESLATARTKPASRALRACALSLIGALVSVSAAEPLPAGFDRPRPGLHTGGVPDADALARFRDAGVRTVIDLRGADERARVDTQAASEALGLRYEVLEIEGAQDLTPENAERLKHALDDAEGQVLLHCASGNRVGALLALMAYHEEGVSRRQALDVGRAAGLGALESEVDQRLRASRRAR
jgi:uncharacterized protein (TIGR01244 family)